MSWDHRERATARRKQNGTEGKLRPVSGLHGLRCAVLGVNSPVGGLDKLGSFALDYPISQDVSSLHQVGRQSQDSRLAVYRGFLCQVLARLPLVELLPRRRTTAVICPLCQRPNRTLGWLLWHLRHNHAPAHAGEALALISDMLKESSDHLPRTPKSYLPRRGYPTPSPAPAGAYGGHWAYNRDPMDRMEYARRWGRFRGPLAAKAAMG